MAQDEVEPVMVIMTFRTEKVPALLEVLARYVVLARSHSGARNIDLVSSVTTAGRFTIIEKWDSDDAQKAHFDSDDMVTMAKEAGPLLTQPPDIDLLEGVTMHDLN